ATHFLLGMLWYFCIDGGTPLVTIRRIFASYNIKVDLLQFAGDWANLPITNGAAVNFDDRGNLGCSTTQEHFLCTVEFCAVNLALLGCDTQLALRQLHHSSTRNAEQNILGGCRSDELAFVNQEDIFSASFRDVPLMCEHNRFIKAVLESLGFGKG